MNRAGPNAKDIVLVGGGHAHVQVMAAFAAQPLLDARLTLVTRDLATPYSGMLPGVVAGLYTAAEAHIDLPGLTAATGTRLVHAEAIGLDRRNKRLLIAGGEPINYDVVSIDVGIAPALGSIAGAKTYAVAVKPIGRFLQKFNELVERCRLPDGPRQIALIGGGAGGVELLLSLQTRLKTELRNAGIGFDGLAFTLITDGDILATHNERVRAAFRRVLAARGVALREHCRARAVAATAIELDNGDTIAADAVLVTTDAAAPDWFCNTGLARDPKGFLAVADTLQSLTDPDVFAAGDCAALPSPREKAGVYAVRAGPPLAANLRRRVRGEALEAWQPQRRHLALISTGERYAVASWGAFKAEGKYLWMIKDWIDRRWVRQYQMADAPNGPTQECEPTV